LCESRRGKKKKIAVEIFYGVDYCEAFFVDNGFEILEIVVE
jgi:hypothetical protein